MKIDVKFLEHFPGDILDRGSYFQPKKHNDSGIDLYAAEDVILAPGERRLVKTGIAIALPRSLVYYHGGTTKIARMRSELDDTPEQWVRIPTHLEAQVRPNSGNALKRGLTVLNTPGTVDNGYRGEVGVILFNANPVVTMDIMSSLLYGEDVPRDGNAHLLDPDPVRRYTAGKKFEKHLGDNLIVISRGDKIAQLVLVPILPFDTVDVNIVEELPPSERAAAGFGSTGIVPNNP